MAGAGLSVSWFKDGSPLKSSDRVTLGCDGDEYFVELSECDAQVAGEYTCTASNVAGDACCTVNVIVSGMTVFCLLSIDVGQL